MSGCEEGKGWPCLARHALIAEAMELPANLTPAAKLPFLASI